MIQKEINRTNQLLQIANNTAQELTQAKQKGKPIFQFEKKLKSETMELAVEVDDLFAQIDNCEKNNLLSKKEIQSKRDQIQNIETQLQYLQKLTSKSTSQNAKLGFQNQQKGEPYDYYQLYNEDQLLYTQTMHLQKQDQKLGDFQETIQRIKLIGFEIHDEIGLHEKLLQKVEKNVDQTSLQLNKSNKKLEKLLQNTSICKLSSTACCLFVSLLCIIFFL